jgi:hypothetical protein
MRVFGSRIVAQVFILLVCGAASLGDLCLTFRDRFVISASSVEFPFFNGRFNPWRWANYSISKRRAQNTQSHGATSQTKEGLGFRDVCILRKGSRTSFRNVIVFKKTRLRKNVKYECVHHLNIAAEPETDGLRRNGRILHEDTSLRLSSKVTARLIKYTRLREGGRKLSLVKLFFPMAQQILMSQGLLFIEASRSHSLKTLNTRYDSSGRVVSPTQRPLPDDTQHSQETSMPPAGFEPSLPASE